LNTELTTAIEGSTYIVTSSFFDETGAAEIPTAIKWSLRDENGAIVNSKSAVSVTPASTITIILSGADLAYTSNQSKRVLTIEAVYTSTLGAGLPIKDEYDIPIRNLIGV
jgi:hypothetical protein